MTCRAGLRGFLRGGTPAAIKARSPGVQESSGPSVRALPGAKAQRTYGSEKKKRFHLFNLPPPNSALWTEKVKKCITLRSNQENMR